MESRIRFEFTYYLKNFFLRMIPFCSRRKQIFLYLKNLIKLKKKSKFKVYPSISFLAEMQKKALQHLVSKHVTSAREHKTLSLILVFYDSTNSHTIINFLDNLESKIRNNFEVFIIIANPFLGDIPTHSRIRKSFTISGIFNVVEAINDALKMAQNEFVLFLNAEISLFDFSVDLLLSELDNNQELDAVSGKIVSADNKIISAGSTIRKNRLFACGVGKWFLDPEFSFRKHIDIPCEDLFMARREKIISNSCFNKRFISFSYALADLCSRPNGTFNNILYQPYALGLYNKSTKSYYTKTKAKENSAIRFGENTKKKSERSVLVIEDKIPDPALGAGAPRSYEILKTMVQLGYSVTYFPIKYSFEHFETIVKLQMLNVEMEYGKNQKSELLLLPFLKKRKNSFNTIVICRPFILRSIGKSIINHSGKAHIIYDAEAIYSIRTINFLKLSNTQWLSSKLINRLINEEVMLAKNADATLTVSNKDAHEFIKRGIKNVHVVSHSVEIKVADNSFRDRTNILFVGGICESPSPNEDALLYFCKFIFPIILEKINLELFIVGTNKSKAIWNLASDKIKVVGRVEDLTPYYSSFRIFIAPSRYSAGIPLKIYEAASKGIPCVITPILAEQLQWKNGSEAMVGKNASHFANQCIRLYSHERLWQNIRQKALSHISAGFTTQIFEEKLSSILSKSYK